MFLKLVDPQLHNTLITEIASFSGQTEEDDNEETLERPTVISANIYDALRTSFSVALPRKAEFLSQLTLKGITYTTAKKHLGNSFVLVSQVQKNDPYPAQIQFIL
jgi:hypothetical protein